MNPALHGPFDPIQIGKRRSCDRCRSDRVRSCASSYDEWSLHMLTTMTRKEGEATERRVRVVISVPALRSARSASRAKRALAPSSQDTRLDVSTRVSVSYLCPGGLRLPRVLSGDTGISLRCMLSISQVLLNLQELQVVVGTGGWGTVVIKL